MMFKEIRLKLMLSENAKLFDTKEYIIKTFCSVIIACLIGYNHPYIRLDMISVLFGMMLTLEPVNMTGIRSGLSQLGASILGALITSLFIFILGYSILTTAISITLTLYICLLIQWDSMMVQAIFTSIYMTQFVQNGNVYDTLRLRLMALGLGLLIAFLMNFIFSFFGYRKIAQKRIYYLIKQLNHLGERLLKLLQTHGEYDMTSLMNDLQAIFYHIDWVYSTLNDVLNDQKRLKFVYRHIDVVRLMSVIQELRRLAHKLYGLSYEIEKQPDLYYNYEFIDEFDHDLEALLQVQYSLLNNNPSETVFDSFLKKKSTSTLNPWLADFRKSIISLIHKIDF